MTDLYVLSRPSAPETTILPESDSADTERKNGRRSSEKKGVMDVPLIFGRCVDGEVS